MDLQVFENDDFGAVRVVTIDGDPWFVGKDVAAVLGYSNPQKAIRDHVDAEDMTVNEMFTVNGTKGILINESGLYSLIFGSTLPAAKKFKRWVTAEVLPAIRKTGAYVAPPVDVNLQRVGLMIRAAEHKAVPQSEQLRLLNMAVRDLTGTEINLTPSKPTAALTLMDLPEVFGAITKRKTKRYQSQFGKFFSIQLIPVQEVADTLGTTIQDFDAWAKERGLKSARCGEWERVKSGREFMYYASIFEQYREG